MLDNKDVFAKRVAERRAYMGLSLQEVAEQVGVSKSTVQRWEKGIITNVKRDKIAALSNALACSASYLFGWTDEASKTIDTPPTLTAKATALFQQLQPEAQRAAITYMQFLLNKD